MQRRAITSAWIIVSLLSGILTFFIMYSLYIFLMPVYVVPVNQILSEFGASITQLNNYAGNINEDINADFIIIPVGVFFFMLVAPYIQEALSSLFEMGSDY